MSRTSLYGAPSNVKDAVARGQAGPEILLDKVTGHADDECGPFCATAIATTDLDAGGRGRALPRRFVRLSRRLRDESGR